MCIYGVKQIGRGSLNASQWLPTLVAALEVLRPLTVFVGLWWLATYLVNRASRTAPLSRRVLALMCLLGLLTIADSAAEASWLVVTKREVFPNTGCCAAPPPDARRYGQLDGQGAAAGAVTLLHAGAVSTLGLGCVLLRRAKFAAQGRRAQGAASAALAAGAVGALISGAWFGGQVAAPTLLGLPHHRCLYCLMLSRPESLLAGLGLVGGGLLAALSTGLAWTTSGIDEVRDTARTWRRNLCEAAAWCLLGYAAMLAWQWILVQW
jgi:hypothetical protein